MRRLGIYVTEEERQHVITERNCSGMWTSDGTHLGDPAFAIAQLAKKYNLPVNTTGLDLKDGEFVSKSNV